MKIAITTKGSSIEKANYILSLALESLKTNVAKSIEQFEVTEKDIADVEVFRKQLLKGYFKESQKNKTHKLSNNITK